MSEWKEYTLGELGTFFGGVTTIKREDYGFGTPFITYKNVYKNSKIDTSILELMNVKSNDVIKRNCIYGDIFFTASSETPDEVAMSSVLLENISDLTFNGFCKRFRLHNFNILIPEYARYLFRGPDFRKSVYEYANGDTRFNISQESLSRISIYIPDLHTQSTYAQILSSLDDKIELNNKINKELESLAQLLFKRWFVDFEFPNEKGEPYKSSGGEMADSELGEIPKGWGVATIGDVTELITKGTTPTTIGGSFTDSGINFIKVESLSEEGTFIKTKFGYIDEQTNQLLKRSIIKEGDVLFSIAGTIGRVAVVTKDILPANTNQAIAILRPDGVDSNFLRLLMKSSLIQNDTRANVVQAVQANLSLGIIKSTKFIRPVNEILALFNNIFFETFRKIELLTCESESLINLRDTLLPKLISGELQINEN